MNIIGGKLKRKKLVTLEGKDTRPTLTRIKENIFNILHNYCQFDDLVIGDVFGGSGSLALEGLSRNAKFAYINDNNIEACKIIEKNVANCGFKDITLVSNFDYKFFFKTFNDKLDLLFIDPPFADISCQQWILDYCCKHELLNLNCLIILETNVYLDNLILKSEFKILTEKKYGKVYITVIQYQK